MTDLDGYLSAIIAGDSAAFASWMAAAEPSLRGGLRSFAATVDTEAVLQETLLRLWQVAPRIKPDGRPNSVLRLGHRIAHNLAISERRRLRTSPVEPSMLAETITDAGDQELREPKPPDPLLRRVIAFCRTLLPKKPAQVLSERLRSAGAEPDEVLAKRLGMSKNTFLQNFTRARKMLGECLRKQGVDLKAELS